MPLSLVTAPSTEPITLDQAKGFLRVEADDENTLIDGLILAARHHVESFTQRRLITQTWDWTRDAFPCADGGVWVLPVAPVSSVSSITYLDSSGASQTWASSNYLTDLPSGPTAQRGRITPAYGVTYPSTYGVINAVTVRFVAGYGATGDDVPEPLRTAMQMLIAHWYANRAPVNIGNIVTPVPMAVDALLWPYRTF